MSTQHIFKGWLTTAEIAADINRRFGHGTADSIRRWKREGRLDEYGLEVRYVGRTPVYRQKPEMKEAPATR
jgi:hypothetical protein